MISLPVVAVDHSFTVDDTWEILFSLCEHFIQISVNYTCAVW